MVHQKIGSLTTMVCLRPVLPLHRATFTALAAQLSAALPLHDCGASLAHDNDLIRHDRHHHPGQRRRMSCPPCFGRLAIILLNLRDCGFHWVGLAVVVWVLDRVLAAAAAAAFDLDAWVSQTGSSLCWLARMPALAIHMSLAVTRSSWALISCRMRWGTLWCTTARLSC